MNQTTMRRLISIGMLLILVVLFTILAGAGKGKFFNFDNLIEVVRDASIPAIIGVGVTFIIITAVTSLSGILAEEKCIRAGISRSPPIYYH